MGTPVVLVSGLTVPWTEFTGGVARVHNGQVCNSCWNDVRFEFDKGDWDWCPQHKGTERQFECSKQIRPEVVIAAIEAVQRLRLPEILDFQESTVDLRL